MTQEEKAKAYDEALTIAKRIISKNCSEVEKLCLKSIFPELAESEDAEQAAREYERENRQSVLASVDIVNAFIEGAKWQANQLLKGSPLPEDTVVFQKGVAEGRRLEREDRNDDKLPRFYGD